MTAVGFQEPAPRASARGRWIFWLLMMVGILAGSVALGGKAIRAATLRAEIESVSQDARLLYDGFRKFEERTGAFPNSFLAPAFELDSADPLRRRGYYRGRLETKLLNGRFDGYDAPDDRGLNREFWLEMTLASDSNVRILVVRSDDAPLSGGEWLDGVYLVKRSGLEHI